MDRERFIWDLMATDPMLRHAVIQIEAMADIDQMVVEYIALFRGMDEVLAELSLLCKALSVSSKSLAKTGS